MTRLLLIILACALAGVVPAQARAHDWSPTACGLPSAPLLVDYAEISVSPAIRQLFSSVRPARVLATSGTALGQELRAGGAHTVFWYMNLPRIVGSTYAPADPETVAAAADRLYDRAVATTNCATPSIALNELNGARLPTPWSPWNAQYRANVLTLVQRLHDRGARPYLLVNDVRPFTATTEAADWWRQVSAAADIVMEVHFSGRFVYSRGPLEAGRLRRARMRSVLAPFTALGIPFSRLGLFHGFQSGHGGRTGLPLAHWLRVVKWEVLAAQQVINETIETGTPLGSDWSWGWGDFPTLSKIDAQKPITACVYLWVRHPTLCDGPGRAAAAGIRFNASLDEGHIWLRPNVACVYGASALPADAVARFATITEPTLGAVGTRAALAALYQRMLERRYADVDPTEVLSLEQEIITQRFAGDADAYLRALAAANADVTVARHVIGEQVRRRTITAALRRVDFATWSGAIQRGARARTVCTRDELPSVAVVDLARWLPFLRLAQLR